MVESQPCPRCGSRMVVRRNRQTGEGFLGCTRYPECRGTRRLPPDNAGTSPQPPRAPKRQSRSRLSHGGRPRGWADDVELLVARLVGRNLGPWEGCVVQMAALAIVGLFFYWLFASGAIVSIVTPLADWYASQVHFGPLPSPSG